MSRVTSNPADNKMYTTGSGVTDDGFFFKKSINIPFSHRLKLLSVSEKLISLYKGPYKTETGHCRLIDPSGESLINVEAPC